MARRRKGRPIDGVLVLDKPSGCTSNAALQSARRSFFAAKAGHTGSLDPLATGVLPLCFGEATKFSQFLLDADKEYLSTFVLGVSTTTGDAEGDELSNQDASGIDAQSVESGISRFRGSLEQVPSMYSAIKHQGTPLYRLAREGVEVEREARPVEVYAFEMLEFRSGYRAEVDVRIRCSKGTYVRSLAEDLGHYLGVGGHVSALRRTAAGPFTLDDAVTLDRIEQLAEERSYAELNDLLLPIDSGLTSIPVVRVPEASAHYLLQGQPVLIPNAPTQGLVRARLDSGEFLGVGEIIDDGRMAPRRLVAAKSPHL
jgi:tRNA pseudouridine55 synthase